MNNKDNKIIYRAHRAWNGTYSTARIWNGDYLLFTKLLIYHGFQLLKSLYSVTLFVYYYSLSLRDRQASYISLSVKNSKRTNWKYVQLKNEYC